MSVLFGLDCNETIHLRNTKNLLNLFLIVCSTSFMTNTKWKLALWNFRIRINSSSLLTVCVQFSRLVLKFLISPLIINKYFLVVLVLRFSLRLILSKVFVLARLYLLWVLSWAKKRDKEKKKREGKGRKGEKEKRGKIRRALVLLSRCAHFSNREKYKEKEQNNESYITKKH